MIEHVKTFSVSLTSITLVEIAELLPPVTGFVTQTIIGVLTIIYLIKKIKKTNEK